MAENPGRLMIFPLEPPGGMHHEGMGFPPPSLVKREITVVYCSYSLNPIYKLVRSSQTSQNPLS